MKPLDSRGFTLIEVIVSLAIFMTMSLMFAGMLSQMNKQMVNSSRKLEILDLKSRLSGTLSYEPICSCIMDKFSSSFDPRNKESLADIREIRSDCAADASVILAPESIVPGSQTRLAIKDVAITDIRSRGNPDTFSGTLRVRFTDDKKTILFQNLELFGFFSTDPSTPISAKKIQTCAFGGGGASPAAPGLIGSCPAGEYVSGMDDKQFYCSPLQPVSSTARVPATITPGKGCEGRKCVALDHGPCDGSYCKTNGLFCEGRGCLATGHGASCDGSGCCAGPHCQRYWNTDQFDRDDD